MKQYIQQHINALDGQASALRLLKTADGINEEVADLIEQAEDKVDEALTALRKAALIANPTLPWTERAKARRKAGHVDFS